MSQQKIADAIREDLLERGALPTDQFMVGDWIVIAEVTDEDGDSWLCGNATYGMTNWKQWGMLASRLDDVKARNQQPAE